MISITKNKNTQQNKRKYINLNNNRFKSIYPTKASKRYFLGVRIKLRKPVIGNFKLLSLIDQSRPNIKVIVSKARRANIVNRSRTSKFYLVNSDINQKSTDKQWKYLEERADSWRKQLFFKGKKLTVFSVYSDMIVNQDTIEDTAQGWELSIEEVAEAIEYCQINQELIQQEAEEERRYLLENGVNLEETTY